MHIGEFFSMSAIDLRREVTDKLKEWKTAQNHDNRQHVSCKRRAGRLPASNSNLQTIRELFVERVINQHK